jgi:tRNA(Arg) A34 adenosine deaminase TadA
MGVIAGLFANLPFAATATNTESNIGIIQPDSPGLESFIARAFEMKRLAVHYGDQAYGAIVVRQNQIIGQSWSKVVIEQDPTAHAEIAAIRDAASRLKSRKLDDCVLYSSSRPCPMCEGAAYWAGVRGMIYGKDGISAGQPQLCHQ